MKRNKSPYRIIPIQGTDNIQWAVKLQDTVIKTFDTKNLADNFKTTLDCNEFEQFKYDKISTFTINI